MNPQQDQYPSDMITMRGTFNLFTIVLNAHCMCFLPFMRRYFGWQMQGICGLAALILIFGTVGFTGSRGIYEFMWFWLGIMLIHRIEGAVARRKGMIIHSRSHGYPEVGMGLSPMKSESGAQAVEIGICAVVGFALLDYDASLGKFVMLGAVSLILKAALDSWIDDMSVQRVQDAELDQRNLSHRYRSSLRGF